MKAIKNWISSQNISLTLTAESELETISAMLDLARQSSAVRDFEALAKNILHHEIMAPSASGCCAVLFRALHDSVIEPALFFGRFDKGIGYYSKNGHPIDLIFLIIAPPEMENEFIAMLQKMEQAIAKAPFREKLRAAPKPKQVIEILIEELT